ELRRRARRDPAPEAVLLQGPLHHEDHRVHHHGPGHPGRREPHAQPPRGHRRGLSAPPAVPSGRIADAPSTSWWAGRRRVRAGTLQDAALGPQRRRASGERCRRARGVTHEAARAVAPRPPPALLWSYRRPPVVALDLEDDRRNPSGMACAGEEATLVRSSVRPRPVPMGQDVRAIEASTLACRGLFRSWDAFTRWRETSGRRAMANPEKVEAVAEIVDLFRASDAAVITEYRGLSVGELKELRRSLGSGTTYAVVKNTLTEIAAREAGIDVFDG